MTENFIIKDIGLLVTMDKLAAEDALQKITLVTEDHLGIKENCWLRIENHHVREIGLGKIPETFNSYPSVSAGGGLVLPGLIDCHRHPVFSGSRTHEFVQKLAGVSYQEIAANGGGINYTVKKTRACPDEVLHTLVFNRLHHALTRGITTIECKSGYGLGIEEELRHLKILNGIKKNFSGTMSITCLPLHADSEDFQSREQYLDAVVNELIPEIKKNNLAQAFDVFIEEGYFAATECESYIKAINDGGFGLHIHADEFSHSGGAALAAKAGAWSADHLQWASHDDLVAMAKSKVIGTILPGTSLYSKIPFTSAQRLINAGVQIAVATDFNPGSCLLGNLAQMATLAAIHCGLPPAYALASVTYFAAKALKYHKFLGVLAPGYQADLLIYPELSSWQDWLANCGETNPAMVFCKGQKV